MAPSPRPSSRRPRLARGLAQQSRDPGAPARPRSAPWIGRGVGVGLAVALALAGCDRRDRDLPAPYRSIVVPYARLASADVRNQGRLLYRRDCVVCHGDLGDGRGGRSPDLSPVPRDFTMERWQRLNDDRHVYFAIAEGRKGSAMLAWKQTLSPGEIWSVVAYIRSLHPAGGRPVGVSPASPAPQTTGRGRDR